MRRIAMVVLMALAGGHAWASPPHAASGPRPEVDLPLEPTVITNPDWEKTPDAAELAKYYPKIASMIGLGGRALLHCTVAVDGGLQDCAAVSESPAGMGFGDAALEMAGDFRMRPRTIDGQAAGGGQINIPIRFQPYVATLPADVAVDPLASLDPRSVALAHRLVVAMHWDDTAAIAEQNYAAQLAAETRQEGLTSQETLALDALKAGFADYVSAQEQQQEAKIARAFSAAQLQMLAALFESPTAQTWFSKSAEILKQNLSLSNARLVASAQRRFCQQVACTSEALPPGAGR